MLLPARLLLLCSLLLTGLAAHGQPQSTLELQQGELILHAGDTPPPEHADWQPVRLPDQWRVSRPGVYGEGWYRFRFDWQPDGSLQAVYLPRASMNAAVYVNGVMIGNGGPFHEPIGRNWNRPLLFIIPPEVLRPGANILHVRLLAPQTVQAALFPLMVGSEVQLRLLHEHARTLRVTLNQTASLLIAGAGFVMLGLWWRRREDSAYGQFGLAALVWALQSTNLYLEQVPLSTLHWEILVNASFSVIAALLMLSQLRFTGTGYRPLHLALWGTMWLAPLAMWLAPAERFLDVTVACHFTTLAITGATTWRLARAAVLHHNRDARLLLGAVGLVLLFGLHDWLMHSKPGWLPRVAEWGGQDNFLLQFAAPVMFLAMAWIMAARYVRVLNEFEALNLELEARVVAKHRELESHFERIKTLYQEQAKLEERERIYQDLHDDVGAKLLSLVYRAENGGNADLARSALQDLRDVVSRTSAEEFNLEDATADWRAECEQRLRAAGLTLAWHTSGDFSPYRLTQPQALDMGRILREAISNTLRHAQASAIAITLAVDDTHLRMEIADDGIGLDTTAPRSPGRGLGNMRKRALKLGAEFSQESTTTHGLRLMLSLPISSLLRRAE
jgi:signal transduction histidine kinase